MINGEERSAAKSILIVEDDPAIGDLLTETISYETLYHPIVVSDGIQALKAVRDSQPDLLLVDYRLPIMSGIELYDQIQAMEGIAYIPTIMTSASRIEKELADRNITVLIKPFDLDELLETIKRMLG